MDVYDVDLSDTIAAGYKRWQNFFVLAAVLIPVEFGLEFITERLWPMHPPRSMEGMAAHAIFFSLFLSLFLSSRSYFKRIKRPAAKYQIVVEEDAITTTSFKSYNRILTRTIRRGEIRTFLEKETGLFISNRNLAGARFFGGIWIPKRLADYEYLKRLLSSWMPKESA